MGLEGKTAIVTGGASGIGRGIALKIAEHGGNVVVADLQLEIGERTAEDLRSLGVRALATRTDVTSPESAAGTTADALGEFGGIDILVNNAGVAGAPGWHEHATSREEDWATCYEVNLKGMVIFTEAVSPTMKEARSGKIVNIASLAAREGRPSLAHYSASKAAVVSYTQSLARELAPFNINANAICPGLLWSAMWEQVGARYARTTPEWEGLTAREVFHRMVSQNMPLGREQTPEDIGELAAFLASEDARNITGQAINVDGGFFMR
jgi:meso-butanediol dehydrogenase/(S,S)-butanediol dehydrogenase/diacetyl reductase